MIRMPMLRSIGLTLALASVALLSSCSSGPSSTAPGKSKEPWVFEGGGLEKRKLATNEIAVADAPGEPPRRAEGTRTFGKVAWLYSFLERAGLHSKLDLQQKQALLAALFDGIPAEPTPDFYRAVAIGGYFDGKTPLVLYARAFKPSERAPKGSAVVLQFTGNFVVVTRKKTDKTELQPVSGMIMPNFNYFTNGILFSDGRVVQANFLYSPAEEKKLRAEGDPDTVAANLADAYTKDEVPENDAGIEGMLVAASRSEKATVEVRTTALLNLYQYFLYAGKADEARGALRDAQAAGKGIADPSFREVLDIQAPQMLALMGL
jgi:hypothetical protein